MSKEISLNEALKSSNAARKALIDKLIEDGVNKDKQIQALKFRIALLKRFISSDGFFSKD